MWPFKRKEPERDYVSEEIEKLKAFRDVGETFNYLGRTCVVAGHYDVWGGEKIPMLMFDYCDNTGRSCSYSARVRELPALIHQQDGLK